MADRTSERTPKRIPNRTPETESHRQTDIQTDVEIGSDVNQVTAVHARARIGIHARTLGDLLTDDGKPRLQATTEAVQELTQALADRNGGGRSPYQPFANITREWDDRYRFTADQKRWPLLRTGDRRPLPAILRASVLRRDQFTCCACGTYLGAKSDRELIEVDHCVPWSAGGPDDSDNLRVLCHWCNQRRSNQIDIAHLRAYRPTTWWCFDCWTSDDPDERHGWTWHNGTDLSRVPYVDDNQLTNEPEQAFCAFCQYYSFTPHLLVGPLGRQLIEQTNGA